MKMIIASVKDGIAIDHIPSNNTLQVMNLLSLESHSENVIVAYNLQSKRMGRKGLIKIASKTFSQAEMDTIALVADGATVNIIKNYKIVKKITIKLPKIIHRIAICPNNNCISNFDASSKFIKNDAHTMRCYYCERIYDTHLLCMKKNPLAKT